MKAMFTAIAQSIHRLRYGITLSNARFEAMVDAVNALADDTAALGDSQLTERFKTLRQPVTIGSSLEDVSVQAFAMIREAAGRTLAMRPYDVQMLAAFAMQDDKCVEMQTGEGKTLAAAIVVSLRALAGYGVYVLTFNDYLAKRDAEWMGPLYRFLGLTVGYVVQGMSREERRASYGCDITYVTAKEAGFDFLRDQLCLDEEHRVQRGFHFAIVDEADSILIDEARIPLVIATDAEKDETNLHEIVKLIQPLQKGIHYEIKSSGRNISLTDSGIRLIERRLGILELHSETNMHLLARINLALQAEELLHRDIDYIVRDNAIEVIDEFTGRVAENRKWPGGLQAAMEAKEGLEIQPQGRILNSITLQQFVGQYSGLAGMTGTASEATDELDQFYNLKVVIVPPNKPCIRVDHPDHIFATKKAKLAALVQEITGHHESGRPVLIGTASVEESAMLARELVEVAIPCRVLNAANDDLEAEIISEAGALGAVTISTNMAGRGTDIRLGGSKHQVARRVVDLGGLYVIGTNRHESRRIDNQLRGRSGRQGDPGESRFFVSLEDNLIARYGIANLVRPPGDRDNQSIRDEQTAKRIEHVQRVIEGEGFEIRRTLRVYSHLLEIQRRAICKDREALLVGMQPPQALQKRDPELRQRLVAAWGEACITESERVVTLIHLDWLWSDHLAHAAEIREGIHLVSFGGYNAYDVFNKEMSLEFSAFIAHVEEKLVETIRTATFTTNGIDLEEQGLKAPSSTWTFMINDNPRGAVLGQIIRGLISRLKKPAETVD
ncbi:MAG: accessory Sec system translocase SecA2 [Planctomycetota bacterium]|nr:accessory Sec system translocase SecA2 [Planctomycetota bacterium]